ncbi:MAG: DUF302 domain-containing protein [Acidiferrobacterales bacterium]
MLALLVLAAALSAHIDVAGAQGLVIQRSTHNVTQTTDRLESVLRAKGMKIFARIDHSAGAQSVGVELPPTILLVFGNPKIGTQLLTSNRMVGIDLPLKALIWEDADANVWLAYNDPAYIARRFDIENRKQVIGKMRGALKKFTTHATGP